MDAERLVQKALRHLHENRKEGDLLADLPANIQ